MKSVPTLYEWLGGGETLERLSASFYTKVLADELIGPLFARMPPDHPRHVAMFLAEVLGGPSEYSAIGGHARMLSHHFAKHLTEAQRRRWLNLLLDTADELKLPDDPEFRSAFIAYLEWGTRLAVANSQLPVETAADPTVPMPKWGWGVPGGPYQPE
jgi:hemoglobin